MLNLSNKIALVTGGSRGLGREMVLAFAKAGADVVIASRKLDACEAVAREVEALGRRALPVAAHVGNWDDNDALAARATEQFGRVDILVNNAGMSPLAPSLAETSEALFDKVIAVNLKGAFRLSALIGTRMAQDGGGSIINVSSIGAISPSPVELPYAAAKAGLNAITAGMARVFGPTVRVNGIMPGPLLTDISTAWDMEAFNARAPREIALQRGGEPHEIVGAALYLASDTASYTTGSIITVDGGLSSSRA
jgi:NAD(P)-dependent dehydrogenase (short-subunit alcohol dehydrogenase family)